MPDLPPPRTIRLILHWLLSLGAAAWLASVLHARFVDDPPPQQWDAALGEAVFREGATWRRGKEGHGTARVGRHGVLGVPDVEAAEGALVAVWGDSYVEGAEVEDEERLPQQVTRAWNARHDPGLLAFGIAAAGRSVPDHLHRMAKWERLLPGLSAHVIVIPGLGDVTPDAEEQQHAKFVSRPRLALVPEPPAVPTAASLARQSALHQLGLSWLAREARRALSGELFSARSLLPGPHEAPPFGAATAPEPPPGEAHAAFGFLLDRLQEATRKPVVFVHLPRDTPEVEDGRVVLREELTELESIFAQECRARGIGFVSLRGPFSELWRREGVLPRGFANSRPGVGHLNARGHRLAAEAAVTALESQADALLAD